MERRIPTEQVRVSFGEVLAAVHYRGDCVLLEQMGEVAAVLVPFEWYRQARGERREAEARATLMEKLSPQERRVLRHVAEGMSERQIAVAESLAIRTTQGVVRSLKDKLGASSLGELGALARGLELLD